MSDFDSGNSVNCVLLDVNLYETNEGKIIGPPHLKHCTIAVLSFEKTVLIKT